jgi:hypothetical protein
MDVYANFLYELPDDYSVGMETCSSVECSLLKWVVFDVFLVLFYGNIVTLSNDSE